MTPEHITPGGAIIVEHDVQSVLNDPYLLNQIIDTYIASYRDTPLAEEFSPQEVYDQLEMEMTLPGAVPFLLTIEKEKEGIVGICWGWNAPVIQHVTYFVTHKFPDLPETTQQQLIQEITDQFSSTHPGVERVSTVSEMAFLPRHRGNHDLTARVYLTAAEIQLSQSVRNDISWLERAFSSYPIMQAFGAEEFDVGKFLIEHDIHSEAYADRLFVMTDVQKLFETLSAGDNPGRNLLRLIVGQLKKNHSLRQAP